MQAAEDPGRIPGAQFIGAEWPALTQTSAIEFSLYALEPEPPRDPLAAAASVQDAVARHLAVLSLPIDDRGQRLLRALISLDGLIAESRERAVESQSMALVDDTVALVDDAVGLATDTAALESDGFEPATVALPTVAVSHVAETQRLDALTDAQRAAYRSQPPAQPAQRPPSQPVGAGAEAARPRSDVAEQFVRAGTRERHQFAAAETIVLSGPDIKRKIRHKQSIMPSYISQVLYEDIGALFEIGDREGALVSLERLLTVSQISPQIETFLAHNEARLLEYYESVLGPWSRVLKLRDGDGVMPSAYFNFDKMTRVVSLLDGQRTLARVLADAGLRHIETCAVLSQLARSASLDLTPKNG